MNLKSIEAIDVHSHYDYGSRYDRGSNEAHCTNIEHIKNMYDSANIKIAFCSTFASVLSSEATVDGNEYNFTMVKDAEWMYQWVVVDPRVDETYKQAMRMLENRKCVGIKIHPCNHRYSLHEFGDQIFSFAADYNTIILIHPEANHLADSVILADKYPDSTLISAHMGSAEHVDLVEHSKHGNIYLDTSGGGSTSNNIVEYAVGRIGSERILFGTDIYASGFQRGRIEYALISDEDKMNILRENSMRLFKRNLMHS